MNVQNGKKNWGTETFFVLDASVIINLIEKEKGFEKAREKLARDLEKRKVRVAVLPLTFWEIGNWAGRKHPRQAVCLLSSMKQCGWEEHHLGIDIMSLTIDIMAAHRGTTFYDASYHALAKILGATLITADHDYYRQCHQLGNITFLKDY